MLRLPLFLVAPEVVDLLGGEGDTRSLLAELFSRPCAACGRPIRLDTDNPAAVLAVIYDAGTGPLSVKLAHPRCYRSKVVPVPEAPPPTGQMTVPAMAWLRGRADPPSVVVIGPRVSTRRAVPRGDTADLMLSALLAAGFELLTDPYAPLSVVRGRLHIEFGAGQRIRVADAAGNTVYDATGPAPDGWAEMVQVTGRLGIVVVRGLDLHDPDRDHLADLFTAIGNGAAVGLAVPADPNPRPAAPDRPQLPDRPG